MSDTDMNELKNTLPLFDKALAIAKIPGRPYDFRCPICGGAAHAIKSTINGHVHAFCNDCHSNIIE